MQEKKKQEEGVPPKGTGPLNPFIKRKMTDKVDCPSKKPKVVTGSTVGEMHLTIKLPPPPPSWERERLRLDDGPRFYL